MRQAQDDCPSVSVSRMRALGEVTEDMARVRVTVAGASREVRLSHMRFPNGGGWSFFICPSCGRRARVLKLFEKIACWRCTVSSSRPLPYRAKLGDSAPRIERLREKLYGGPLRAKPRPGRTLDRRWRLEASLRRAPSSSSAVAGASLIPMLKPIPASCAHLDLEAVGLELIRAGASVRKAAKALAVPTHDLRLLTLAHPRLMDAALEAEELALDEAEAIVRDTLRCDDTRKRIRAAGFLLRNCAAGRRRGFGPVSGS